MKVEARKGEGENGGEGGNDTSKSIEKRKWTRKK